MTKNKSKKEKEGERRDSADTRKPFHPCLW